MKIRTEFNIKKAFKNILFITSSILSVSNVYAAPLEQIKEVVTKDQSAYLETLKGLVNIESGSKDWVGVNQISELIAAHLKKMDVDVSIIQPKKQESLEATIEKTGPIVKGILKGNGTRNIMLLAHSDTVYQQGQLKDQPFRIEKNKVYGLGILDDKQGVAAVIHIVKALKELNYKDYGMLTIVINSDEEISSPGSREFITNIAKNQDAVFSFESGSIDGRLMLATSGIGAAYLDITGKASHAGVKPEAGVNALTELAYQIGQMQDLSNPNTGLKLNWTIANAGKTRNVIPDLATAQADVRSLKNQDFIQLDKTLQQRVKNKKLKESDVKIKLEVRRPPLEETNQAKKLANLAQNIYKSELNLPMLIQTEAWGGGTDAAFAGLQSKAAIIEGMGMSGDGLHSDKDEFILLDSIVPRLYLATRLIMEVSKQK